MVYQIINGHALSQKREVSRKGEVLLSRLILILSVELFAPLHTLKQRSRIRWAYDVLLLAISVVPINFTWELAIVISVLNISVLSLK